MEYLQHHGVQGMHWGERRYQNPDGTLTPLGKEHYRKETDKINQLYGEYDRYHHNKTYKAQKDHEMDVYKRGAISSAIPFAVATALAATGPVPLYVYSVGITAGAISAGSYAKYKNMQNTYKNGKKIAEEKLKNIKDKKISEIEDYEVVMLDTEPVYKNGNTSFKITPIKSKRVNFDGDYYNSRKKTSEIKTNQR